MTNTIEINEHVKIEFDDKRHLYRVYKDGRKVAYSDVLEEAKEYASHYINDEE